MNIAITLTLSRFFCMPFFIFALSRKSFTGYFLSILIFILATLTDHLDGIIARKLKQVTNLGKFLDPLADKILVLSALIYFLEIESLNIPAWMIIAIFSREFIITGLRTMAALRGQIVAALFSGKFKTTLQMITIIYILAFLTFKTGFAHLISSKLVNLFSLLPYWLMLLTTITTLYSGISYIYKYREFLKY